MKCPFCAHGESKVIDSRPADEGVSIRRRRECLKCQKRFTTYETVERMPLVVVKRDGSRQTFDRIKLINGMLRACEKRPVALQDIDSTSDAFYDVLSALNEEDADGAVSACEKLQYHIDSIVSMEHVTLRSVF